MDRLDKVFYINLEDRKDRNDEIMNELNSNFKFQNAERFNAIKHERGALGCLFSHIELLRLMELNGWNTMMIVEDDLELLTDRDSVDMYIHSFLDENTFDILCLGNNCQNFTVINEKFCRCIDTQTTSCYVIKRHMIIPILQLFIPPNEDILHCNLQNVIDCNKIIDVEWKQIQPVYWFVMPVIRQVKQRKSFSDIEKIFVDYNV
jgi:GR25 family glycosyltransferase involved in LPS biosynthesis